MELDRLELIRRLCTQIPAPGQHLVRYYGWYANRSRGARGEVVRPCPAAVIREVKVLDRILAHLWRVGGNDPWEGTAQRGPPAESAATQ